MLSEKRFGVDHFRSLLKAALDAGEDDGAPCSLSDLPDFGDEDGLIQVCSGVAIEKADGERTKTFTISTGAVDRHGDTISPRGWQLENFRKGGTVLFGHSSFHPVARPTKTWVPREVPPVLKGTAKFADTPFAEEIHALVEGGFLRSSSVGFRPKEWELNKDRQAEGEFFYPLDFKKQELLEWSVVPVPANPEALVEAAAKGCQLVHWAQWAEKALDGEGGPHIDLVVPRSAIEAGRKAIGAAKTYSVPSAPEGSQCADGAAEPSAEAEPAHPTPTPSPKDAIVELVEDVRAAQETADTKAARLRKTLEDLVCDAATALTDALAVVRDAQDTHGVEPTEDLVDALKDVHEQITERLGPCALSDGDSLTTATQTDEPTEGPVELDLDDLDEADLKSLGSLAAQAAKAAVDQAMGRVPD